MAFTFNVQTLCTHLQVSYLRKLRHEILFFYPANQKPMAYFLCYFILFLTKAQKNLIIHGRLRFLLHRFSYTRTLYLSFLSSGVVNDAFVRCLTSQVADEAHRLGRGQRGRISPRPTTQQTSLAHVTLLTLDVTCVVHTELHTGPACWTWGKHAL